MSRSVEGYAALLRKCGASKALSAGKQLHDSILRDNAFPPPLPLFNLLIHMYGSCGALLDAHSTFDHMPLHNIFSWNLIMGAYLSNGNGKSALALFHSLHFQSSCSPDMVSFITALSACALDSSSSEGLWLHQIILLFAFESHVIVATALLSMYGRCGRIEHARWTFNNMPERNIFSWNAMLAGFAQHGDIKEVMQLFNQMMQEGLVLDRVTCISAISVCGNQGCWNEGKRLHAFIMGSAYEADIRLQNALVSFYGKCGNKEGASTVFHAIQEKNLITWNAIIAAFAQAQRSSDMMEAFMQMRIEGVMPDEVTFSSIFSAFASDLEIFEAKFLHACVTGCVHELDIVVGTAIITMYRNCGKIKDAWKMFDKIIDKDVSVWNAMITAYSQHGDVEAAISLFYLMLAEDQMPDKVTFVALLSVCADEAALTQGKWIHEHIVSRGIKLDLQIGNSLVNLYGKCGIFEDALEVFCNMPERNLVSWSTLICLFTLHDLAKEALNLFEQMLTAGVFPDKVILLCILPACAVEATLALGRQIHHCILSIDFEMDAVSLTALLNMYSKCGSMKDAERMFDRIAVQSLVSWNSLIAAYAHHGHGVQVITCFNRMLEQGLIPDECTFYSVLTACSHAGLLEEGLHYFSSMVQQYCAVPKVEHFNCMMDLLGRAGQLDNVDVFLKRMPLQPTGASWMTLLSACCLHLGAARGKYVATEVYEINPEDATPLVLLSNVFTASGRVHDIFSRAGIELKMSSTEQLCLGGRVT